MYIEQEKMDYKFYNRRILSVFNENIKTTTRSYYRKESAASPPRRDIRRDDFVKKIIF
jgi:hypothetical protein